MILTFTTIWIAAGLFSMYITYSYRKEIEEQWVESNDFFNAMGRVTPEAWAMLYAIMFLTGPIMVANWLWLWLKVTMI